ncbi:hypothetical protein NQ317_005538 [Molorchus minor]|uniref:Retrotransposon gag domain-containing protein n=1 Tax=Molorchus minor TaxID=1323400 RepID=A0ABQ9JPC1_9CUCU|nr:hypothetical protein NQ317_005538 [Molorchus minor]
MLENTGHLKKHLEEKITENSSNLEARVIEKMLESTGNLKKHLEEKIIENCVNLEERLENKLSETKQQLDQKIRKIESQFALLSSKTDLSPPGAADENVGEVNSSPNKDVKIKEDYEQLIKHLEMRYGQTNLEHVYHSQLKNRYQKPSETLKEFQVDISRLVRLAYPATPEAVMERLAVQAFLDGLRDGETRQALILARPTNLVDALTRALEFEAAKQCAKGQARIRQVEEDSNGDTMEATIRKFVKEALSEAKKGAMLEVKPTPWRLRTATGQPATIHGEVGVTFNIGNTCFNGQVLVADIEDELILGMDIMNTKGFKLNFKRGVLQINEEEVVLHGRTEERVRVVLAEDSSISERCEAILYACPDGRYDEGSIMMVEPGTHDSEARYGVTREEQRDLFQVPAEFALAHCVAQDLQMSRGIAAAFKEKFGNVDELRRQRPEVGDVLQLGGDETSRRVFYLVTKHLSRDKPTYENKIKIVDPLGKVFDVKNYGSLKRRYRDKGTYSDKFFIKTSYWI